MIRTASVIVCTLVAQSALAQLVGIQNSPFSRSLVQVDPLTGQTTNLGGISSGEQIAALAFDSGGGRLLAFNQGGEMLELDPMNGDVLNRTDIPGASFFDDDQFVGGATYDAATDTLYASLRGPNTSGPQSSIVTIDTATGDLTELFSLGLSNPNLTIDPATGTLYSVDVARDQLLSINPVTQTITEITPQFPTDGSFANVTSMVFDPATGSLLAFDNTEDAFQRINPITGAITEIGTSNLQISGLTFVPAPGAAALLAVAACGCARRRRLA